MRALRIRIPNTETIYNKYRTGTFLTKNQFFNIYYFCAFLLREVPPVVEGQVLLCSVHELLRPRLRSVRILHLSTTTAILFSVFADPGCLTRIPEPNFFHPGFASKNFSILTLKNFSKLSEIWSGLFILDPDPDFLPIPDPGSKRHQIPDLQHWFNWQ